MQYLTDYIPQYLTQFNIKHVKSTAKERLLLFLSVLGMGQKKFEESVGLSNGYVNKLKSSPSSDVVAKIVGKYPQLNSDWLITGEGDMLRCAVTQYGNDNNNQQGDGNIYRSNDEKAYKTIMMVVETNQSTTEHFIEIEKKSQEQIDRLISQIDRLISLLESK